MALSLEGPPPFVRHSNLWAAEQTLVAYLALFSTIALFRVGPSALAARLIGEAFAIAVIVLVVARLATSTTSPIRQLYLFALLPRVYGLVGHLNHAPGTVIHDPLIQRWEAALFGGQPSYQWWQTHPSGLWSTILHGAYFSFYAILLAPTVYFVARRKSGDAQRATLWIFMAMALSYVCFVLFPVAGPYYEFPRPTGPQVENAMARLVYTTLAAGSAYGAAFPSSHVAAAWVSTAAAWAGSRRLGALLAVPTALLTVGVVYTQMHYAIDALAGGVLGSAVVTAGWWWEKHSARR
jgi:membrane-associated phospholipid phosphatase